MNKLTQQEAVRVLEEASHLHYLHLKSKARLGQAIWWCYTENSTLPEELKEKLYNLIDKDRGTDDDFYYWRDEVAVTNKFYELYVEQY